MNISEFFFFLGNVAIYCLLKFIFIYRVGIEHTHGETTNAYAAATMTKPATIREEPPPKPDVSPGLALSDSDSDSN